MIDLQSWENSVLGQRLTINKADAGQCSQVSIAWAMALFPGIKWSDLLVALGSNASVGDWAGKSTKYFTWIENNHADVNQLPLPGDIMVFDNHTGVCKSASPSGYTLIEQNAPGFGSSVHDTSYPWRYRNCKGWFRAVDHPITLASVTAPVNPPQASGMVGKTLHLPAKNPDGSPDRSWCVYNEDGPYDVPHAVARLNPAQFGGLDYQILRDLGNGIYVIQTQMFGRRAIWTRNTNATIS